MLDTLNKFGHIFYNDEPYIPLSHDLKGITEEGFELYEVKAISCFYGWEPHHTYPRRYLSYVPHEWNPEGHCIERKEYEISTLLVASYAPTGSNIERDWIGRPKISRITYAGKTYGLAQGALKRTLKKRMMKQMGLKEVNNG